MAYRINNRKALQRLNRLTPIGDDGSAAAATPAKPTLDSVLSSSAVKTAAGAAMLYHGYKRTGSIVWALLYGLAGRTSPMIAVPIAAAQGFGTKKTCP